MSLWTCSQHGLYGGSVHCPKCGAVGTYADLPPEEGSVVASGKVWTKSTWEAAHASKGPAMNASGIIPVEFFVVVELDKPKERTAGGIILPTQTIEADKLAGQEGTLVAASPHAFSYADDWPEGTKPQVGQRVLFKKWDGTAIKRGDRDYKLLNDKSIIAILEPESDAQREAA